MGLTDSTGIAPSFTTIQVLEVAGMEMYFPEGARGINFNISTDLCLEGSNLQKTIRSVLSPNYFWSPKKDGGFHPVMNLKALNKYIQEEHFKIGRLNMVKNQGNWLVKIDLKDAYLLIMTRSQLQPTYLHINQSLQ